MKVYVACYSDCDGLKPIAVFADEKSEITQEGMDVLASIGVFAEASAEKSLTRAEAAKLLLYMLESK